MRITPTGVKGRGASRCIVPFYGNGAQPSAHDSIRVSMAMPAFTAFCSSFLKALSLLVIEEFLLFDLRQNGSFDYSSLLQHLCCCMESSGPPSQWPSVFQWKLISSK